MLGKTIMFVILMFVIHCEKSTAPEAREKPTLDRSMEQE